MQRTDRQDTLIDARLCRRDIQPAAGPTCLNQHLKLDDLNLSGPPWSGREFVRGRRLSQSIDKNFSPQPSTVRAQCPDRKGPDRKCRLSSRHTQLATRTPRGPPRPGLSNAGIAPTRQAANGHLQVPGHQRLGHQATGHVRERSSISFD
jgi:hypothetical protein